VTAAANTALMNRIYRRQRHIYNATRKYFLLGRDRVIDRLDARTAHRVLEIGCGTGRNLVLAAERYPGAIFFGIDISTEMLNSAIAAIGAAGLSSRVRVAHADAVTFDPQRLFGTPRFDRIFISYSLSMIPGWRTVLDLAVVSLAPGGELHVVDFGGQARLPRSLRTTLRWWLSLFHVTPRDRLELELDARARRCGATVRTERPYRDYAFYAVLKRPG
jgi:S-adenosylmethionine-diacylgycerolhomoserine-N-methlytransferase